MMEEFIDSFNFFFPTWICIDNNDDDDGHDDDKIFEEL